MSDAASPGQRHMPTVLAVCSIASFTSCLLVNYFGTTQQGGYFSRNSIKDVSERYPTPITPANWAFAIWGLIFGFQALWVLLLGISVALSTCKERDFVGRAPTTVLTTIMCAKALGFWMPIAWVLEATWVVAFTRDILWLSLILISCAMLALYMSFQNIQSLVRLDWALQQNYRRNNGTTLTIAAKLRSLFYVWVVSVPTSVNFGWICIASTVNGFALTTK